MKILTSCVMLAAIAAGTVASAGPEESTAVIVAIEGEAAHAMTTIHLAGANMDFDLEDMQVGESRSLVDQSGRAILITRQEDGYEFNVDGKNIDVPYFPGNYTHGAVNMATPVDVHAFGAHSIAMTAASDNIVVMSGEALDASTQESIRAVLQSAGHDSEVRFIDRSQRHVNIIEQR